LEFYASSEGIDKNLSKKKNGRKNKKNTDTKIGDTEMTYKELLFKMADKKMLTLSADKDGRGLFWAGMDNMDALDQKVDFGDFTHNHSKEEVNAMRETLAESEWEGLKDRDLKEILRDGCIGWNNMPDRDVIDSHEDIYGESDNYEEVPVKDKQGKIVAKFNDIK
jgi:hypothetical protein